MKRLDNKGQSLVLFIVMIPVMLGIMALVVDMGNAMSKKNEIDNVIEFVLDYGIETGEVFFLNEDKEYFNEELINWKDELEILLNYNLKACDNEIILKDKTIIVSSKTYVEGIFSNVLNIKGFPIESEYKGYIENGEQVIKKVK